MISHWRALVRDPLVHFTFFGVLLYGGYRWWGPDPQHIIVVSKGAVDGMTAEIRNRTGREPGVAAINAAIDGEQ